MLRVRQLSPPGVSALTVVELSGPLPPVLADSAGRPVLWPRVGEARRARLGLAGDWVDEVLVVGRAESAELHLHGGSAVLERACQLLISEPSCRTAPAPRPLSLAQCRAWASAVHGPLAELDGDLLRLGADDRAFATLPGLRDRLHRARAGLRLGQRLCRPAVVALVGRPNAGKSTLFNAWVGACRALVSPWAGTTRDPVSAWVALRGIPIQLTDTAGIRDGSLSGPAPDLTLHLLSEPDEPSIGPEPRVSVLGRLDQRPGGQGVSGLSGAGLENLQSAVADELSLSDQADDHAWAPTEPGQIERLKVAWACLGMT